MEIARITWARKVVVGNWLRRGVAEKGEVLGLGGQLAGLGGCLAGWGLHGWLFGAVFDGPSGEGIFWIREIILVIYGSQMAKGPPKSPPKTCPKQSP